LTLGISTSLTCATTDNSEKFPKTSTVDPPDVDELEPLVPEAELPELELEFELVPEAELFDDEFELPDAVTLFP
jgi:hypothetical protein